MTSIPSAADVPSPRVASGESTEPAGSRVTTLELFFDLVFVFIITQLTRVVAHAHGPTELARAFLVLAITWWMYGGYAWLTNNIDLRGTAARLLILAGMAGFFVMALCIPHVGDRDGVAFGLALLLVVVVHAALFTRAPNSSARAIYGIAPFNLAAVLLVLAAGIAPPRWNLAFWLAALAAPLSSMLLRAERGFSLSAGHFAERHGLIILIAIGESVVGLGIGAGDTVVDATLAGTAVLGLALSAALWWTYFDRDDVAGEHAIARADGAQRATLGVQAYWLAHLVMIAGIVVMAAGVEAVVGDAAGFTARWHLGVGVATYLVGEATFRTMLRMGGAATRAAAASLALATVPVGALGGERVQLAVLVALLAGMLVVERRISARTAPSPGA
jgi:low temperature requirement protein LtrA